VSESRETADEYDLKQCGRCAAWIPRTATMCAYCQSSSPDARIDPRPSRSPVGLPPFVTVTRVLIAVNCLYFLFSFWVQARGEQGAPVARFLIEGQGAHPGRIAFGLLCPGAYDHERVVAGEWWRVLAATFLHAGLIHLGMNMFALNQLGHIAEELFGSAKVLAVYLVCGACSALAISVWFVHVRHVPPGVAPAMVGASGAIFGIGGLLAAFLLKRGNARGRQIGWSIAQNLGLMLMLGFLIPAISNTGHVGGMLPGIAFGLVVRDRFSTRISPVARRNWWLLATLAGVVAVVSLARGVVFTSQVLGGPR
jgi:membrane associated rhomboid family serine protease